MMVQLNQPQLIQRFKKRSYDLGLLLLSCDDGDALAHWGRPSINIQS